MPRVLFQYDFDWYPPELKGRWMRAYKAGWSGLVTTPCATEAGRLGKIAESGEGAAQAGGHPAQSTKRRQTGARSKR